MSPTNPLLSDPLQTLTPPAPPSTSLNHLSCSWRQVRRAFNARICPLTQLSRKAKSKASAPYLRLRRPHSHILPVITNYESGATVDTVELTYGRDGSADMGDREWVGYQGGKGGISYMFWTMRWVWGDIKVCVMDEEKLGGCH